MNEEWQRLYDAAKAVTNPLKVPESISVGSVGAAVLSKNGNLYTGIWLIY